MNKAREVATNIFSVSLILLAFSIPLYRFAVIPSMVLMILSFIAVAVTGGCTIDKRRIIVLVPSLLFVLYLVGMSYSEDKNEGWFSVEKKLSFLIFPVVFFFFPGRFSLRGIVNAFVIGNVLHLLVLLALGMKALKEGVPDPFFYDQFSFHFHPSYLGLYNVISLAVINVRFLFSNNEVMKWERVLFGFSAIVLVITLFLIGSKSGLVSFGLLVVISAISLMVRGSRKTAITVLLLSMISLCFLIIEFPKVKERFVNSWNALKHSGPEEGTSDRLKVWKSSLHLFSKRIFTGYGTGDVQNVLQSEYKSANMSHAAWKKLNAHNQFLQSGLAVGISGVLVLLWMFLFPFYSGANTGNFFFSFFLIVFFVNFLVEAMLEMQAGVVIFSYFYSLLLQSQVSGKHDTFFSTTDRSEIN